MSSTVLRQKRHLVALFVGCGLFVYVVHLAFYFYIGPSYYRGLSWESKSTYQTWPEASSLDVPPHPHPSPSPSSVSLGCLGYPLEDSDVVIAVKTGATEAMARIPMLLATFLSCAKNDVLFFSDMEQDIGEVHVHDALVDVVDRAKKVNDDFELYELQKKFKEYGDDVSSLSKAKEAWALDKYKNIHIAQKAWELRPNRTWYFFIDADTYVLWPSFFAWLKRLDPTKDLYLGRMVHTENLFAQGGSGYLISQEALRRLVGEDAGKIASDFDISASTTCCGDAELAGSLSHKAVSLIDAYPLINDQKPRELQFGRYWCQPIVTMHHMSPEETNDLWQFQLSRAHPEMPLLFEELSSHITAKFSHRRANWNNIPGDTMEDVSLQTIKKDKDDEKWEKDPANACMETCQNTTSCFQYVWDGTTCKVSNSFFSLGSMKTEEGGSKWVSGWNLEAVADFRNKSACKDAFWQYNP